MGFLNNSTDKPLIGISLGDFNGIGPEVIIKTLSDTRILNICIPVVYGSYKILARYKRISEAEDVVFNSVKSIEGINPKKVNLISCWEDDFEVTPGKVTEQAGKCALISLQKATEDVVAGKTDAVVTAPINKHNIQSSEFNFPGHTEYFTAKAGVTDSLMLLVTENLRVGVVTGHIPLSEVRNQISKERIAAKINLMYKSLKNDFGIQKPKIAVLGLNPHAGENGLLGTEEQEIIIPLLEELKTKGMLVFGPFPADGFFGMHQYKKFDAVLAMYHDQGLIPFKALAFDCGVNFTAGLPFVRTSPDHGTAYDIAGKNIASESSFREALYLACDIIKAKKPVLA
ncbi:MAG TPA: 4-hydroxythreonine-4-phosphate dehydrogenase PdxA [Cytophagaceae bacterium]|jgi:4-hydroxythreonine-4-phosphate dehydrogenase|nr:4-hydroxythreonine-4-phosphate dehydrogenase PdxA [Cytophagaceae bacterium]